MPLTEADANRLSNLFTDLEEQLSRLLVYINQVSDEDSEAKFLRIVNNLDILLRWTTTPFRACQYVAIRIKASLQALSDLLVRKRF